MRGEFGSPVFENDDDEKDINVVEVAPPQEVEGEGFIASLKEFLKTDDEEEEKKGFFSRLKLPGLTVDKAEEVPEEPAEQEPERPFSLSLIGGAEISEPDEVKQHDVEPEVFHPETPLFEEEITPSFDAAPEQEAPEAVDKEPEIDDLMQRPLYRQQPLQKAAERDFDAPSPVAESEPEPEAVATPVTPVVGGSSGGATPPPLPTVMGGGPGPRPPEASRDDDPDAPEYATREEARDLAARAGAVGAGVGIIGALFVNRRAKKREKKLEHRSKKRDTLLDKKIEAHKQETEVHQTEQERMRRHLEEVREQQRASDAAHQQALRIERQARTVTQQRGQAEQTPRPQPLQETYSPDVHDRVPPKVAFEQLTGIEQPKSRSVEQERRHEVKDDPSKIPVSYTQADPNAPWNQQSQSPQSARSTLVNLGSNQTPSAHKPTSPASNSTYKKAAISGVITAIVILAVLLALVLFT